eukprot:scaffold15740_cov108-Isochrysis_galbana.AAC.3
MGVHFAFPPPSASSLRPRAAGLVLPSTPGLGYPNRPSPALSASAIKRHNQPHKIDDCRQQQRSKRAATLTR